MRASINIRAWLAVTLFLLPVTTAAAAPLTVVDVGAPAINCVFNTTCTITVTDSVGPIVVPGATGTARLQSRTYLGATGAPAAGKTGYEYRVDLTKSVAVGKINCVTQLKLDFGPISKFHYKSGGPLSDLFVVTSGGLGSVGIASADQSGSVITFKFAGDGVCPGASPGKGATSYFFGLAAVKPAKAITAQVAVAGGTVNVPARAPNH